MKNDTNFKITLRNDYAFKRIFGTEENTDILQNLLECILDILPENIAGLELLDKEFHKEILTEKLGILDIKLRLKDETIINIEIQNRWRGDFPERSVYYWSKMYNESIKQGQDYTNLPKCITINLIGKGFNKNKRLHNKYFVMEKLLDESNYTDIKTKRLLSWLKFIETDDREVRKMLAQNSKTMKKANAAIEVMEMSPRDKWLYESRMKYQHDMASEKHEGYTEGVYQTKLETAKNLVDLGVAHEVIMQATGLKQDEINNL